MNKQDKVKIDLAEVRKTNVKGICKDFDEFVEGYKSHTITNIFTKADGTQRYELDNDFMFYERELISLERIV